MARKPSAAKPSAESKPRKKKDYFPSLYADLGMDSYVYATDLTRVARRPESLVLYRYGEFIRTARLEGNVYWKNKEGFGRLAVDDATFTEFLKECAETARCRMPSSFGSPFHKLFRSPALPRSVNAPFSNFFRGGWQEAKFTGKLRGNFYHYDINSAYLWSSTLGLPRTDTLELQFDVRTDLDGCYVIDQGEPRSDLPYPFSTESVVIASLDEIEIYNLNIRRVIAGFTWRDVLAPDAITSVVNRFSFSKQMARAYWGRWASVAQIECDNKTRKWKLRNPIQNYIWAHLIVSRVKMRVWEEAWDATHVFVDSIIIPRKIETGTSLGGWKLVKEYLDGVRVDGPGRFGPMRGALDKHAGTGE